MAPRAVFCTLVAGALAADYQCPGSGASAHASMKVTATAAASCNDVSLEILSRAGGKSGWVDPHNGGVYSVLSSSGSTIQTQRTTNPATSVGGNVYTDKQTFVLSDADGGCRIEACSESQGASFSDFSTNYCDIRNLYCGSADGCSPVSKDFTHSEDSHKGSLGAGHDAGACIVKGSSATLEAASKTCHDYFGNVHEGLFGFVTIVDPDVGITDASKPYCDGAGASSPCTYIHKAGFRAECVNPAPPDGCHRYIKSRYSRRCRELAAGNFSNSIDTTGLFNEHGVFKECSHELVGKPEVTCYGPPADDPQPCECPQSGVVV